MATTWTDEEMQGTALDQADLLIGGGFKLLIGGGFNLIIQPQRPDTVWTDEDES